MRDHRAYPRAADASTEQRAGQSLTMAIWILVLLSACGVLSQSLPFGYCAGRCVDCKTTMTCVRWKKEQRKEPPVLHPEDWPGVKLAFEAYSGGSYSDASVADLLNANGYRSRTRRGRELWSKHSVAWLLTNRTYTGRVIVNG